MRVILHAIPKPSGALKYHMTTGESTSQGGAAGQDQLNSSQRILVADDDPYIRTIIYSTLIQIGYQVDTAKDGAEAWKALNEASYSLLITDYKMPRVDGLELITKLRFQDKSLPVILVSGTMPVEALTRQPGLRIGAMLEKPFTADELLDAVKRVTDALVVTSFADVMLQPQKLAAALRTTKGLPRILLVDDDRNVRQRSMAALTASDYDVEAVPDGAAGWQALQANTFDLIITDNHMPRMTGLEMIERMRAAHIATPVIMATHNLPTHEFVHKPWLKPKATLQRPFTLDDLLKTIKGVLDADNGKGGHSDTLVPSSPE
jgi:DNA-binding response OmpR family regulator